MTAALLLQIHQAAVKAANALYERDAVICHAHAEGISLRAIAEEAGLSFQRIHQVVQSKANGGTTRSVD